MKHETVIFVCQNCKSDVKAEIADLNDFRRETFNKFYAWLDELPMSEYDNMSLTEKCEAFILTQNPS